MRFLCLHGMGTNASIYEAQLAPILAHLNASREHEFVFIDGTIECEPDAGVAAIFPPPYYCYYSKPTQEQLLAAYDLVYEVLEDEGPFDGAFGFSQGAALIASMLLHRRKTEPGAPDLFKMVVFTCASLPFDLASNAADSDPKYHTVINPYTGAVSVRGWIAGVDRVETSKVNGYIAAPAEGEEPLRRYHPERERHRIPTITVHVLGEKDPYVPQSRALVELCEDVEVVTHEGGHELPRSGLFPKKAAQVISSAISKALFRC